MIRLLATDLDGTFWGSDFVPPPEHVAAVDELARQDVTVCGVPEPESQSAIVGPIGWFLEVSEVPVSGA
ncbi:MAG: hypothetical protein ACLPYY_21280 [Acidimicrobiales bacterium]